VNYTKRQSTDIN